MHWAAASLASVIQQQASWRRALAQKFPNDARNTPAAHALERLARFVEGLAETDEDLTAIVALDPFDSDRSFHAGPASLRALGRYGYDPSATTDPRAFVRELVLAVREDRSRRGATWSPGVGTLRFDYPSTHIATYKGEIVEVLSVVAASYSPPRVLRRPDGLIDVAIPQHFQSETVRFRIRPTSPLQELRGEHWVGLDELDDAPRPLDPQPEPTVPLTERWGVSPLDGTDTYLWSHAPLEVGVCAKLELSARDAAKSRLVGDSFEPPTAQDDGFHDVVVSVEPHFVPEMRFIRVVRLQGALPEDPRHARGAAVRAYLERCHRLRTEPSGWVNSIEPNWFIGLMDADVIRIAGETGPLAQAAVKELLERGFFQVGSDWVPNVDSGRGPGIAVGGGRIARTRRAGRP